MLKKTKSFFEAEIEKVYQGLSITPEMYGQIRLSKDYMEKRYGEKIELSDIAESACLSRFHYVRLFQRIYGVTPRAFLRDVRMTKAKYWLKTGMPITQVCFEVGYESLPTFCSVFKKCIGHTPKQYQKRQSAI